MSSIPVKINLTPTPLTPSDTPLNSKTSSPPDSHSHSSFNPLSVSDTSQGVSSPETPSNVTPIHPLPNLIDQNGKQRVQVWGHRGASSNYPENTLSSYRAAIAEGCEGIESGESWLFSCSMFLLSVS